MVRDRERSRGTLGDDSNSGPGQVLALILQSGPGSLLTGWNKVSQLV